MRGAIFDLDGTLADTSRDLLAAANAVLGPEGLPLLDPVADRPVAGRGGRSMIRRSLEIAGRDPDCPAEEALTRALYGPLLDAYSNALAVHTRLFDGTLECLSTLADRGWRLGVCTNKPEGLAVRLLEELGVHDRFGVILGADSLSVRKPDPRHFFETCRRIGAMNESSVMLGDTITDLSTAKAAGAPCILTRFGFAAEPVDSLGADHVVDHYDEIVELMERAVPPPASA